MKVKKKFSPYPIRSPVNRKAAGKYGILPFLPHLDRLTQSFAGFIAVSFVERQYPRARGRVHVVSLHEENVGSGGAHFRAVSVAAEVMLDSGASRVDAPEVTVELHVVLLGVNHYAVRMIVTLHHLAQVRAVAELALEYPRQHSALAAVVAVVALHRRDVYLLSVRV